MTRHVSHESEPPPDIDLDQLDDQDGFWTSMAPALAQHGRDPQALPPGPGYSASIRRRLEHASSRQPLAMPRWWAWSGWAAAAALLVALLYPPSQPIAIDHNSLLMGYLEDGTAVTMPADYSNQQRHGNFYTTGFAPLHEVQQVSVDDRLGPRRETRPWLGVVTKSVSLKGLGHLGGGERGLLIVRVMAQGPAAQAGLQPGDVLLSFAQCSLSSRYCIAHALKQQALAPGDNVDLVYWRPGSDRANSIALTLSSLRE